MSRTTATAEVCVQSRAQLALHVLQLVHPLRRRRRPTTSTPRRSRAGRACAAIVGPTISSTPSRSESARARRRGQARQRRAERVAERGQLTSHHRSSGRRTGDIAARDGRVQIVLTAQDMVVYSVATREDAISWEAGEPWRRRDACRWSGRESRRSRGRRGRWRVREDRAASDPKTDPRWDRGWWRSR